MSQHHTLYEKMQELGISLSDVGRMVGRSPSAIQKQLTDPTRLKPYVEDAVKVAIAQKMAEQDGSTVSHSDKESSIEQSYLSGVVEKLSKLGDTVVLEPSARTAPGSTLRPDLVLRTGGPVPREAVFELKMRPKPEFRMVGGPESRETAVPEPQTSPKAAMLATLDEYLRSVEAVEILLAAYGAGDIGELKSTLLEQRKKVRKHRSVFNSDGDKTGAENLDRYAADDNAG